MKMKLHKPFFNKAEKADKKKKARTETLIANTYNEGRKDYSSLFAFKYILTLVFAVSFIYAIYTSYGFRYDSVYVFVATLIFTGIFSLGFTYLKPVYVVLIWILLLAGQVYFFLLDPAKIRYIIHFLLETLNSRYINTDSLLPYFASEQRLTYNEKIEMIEHFTFIATYFFSFIFTKFIFHKQNFIAILLTIIALFAPILAAEKIESGFWFAPITICLFGIYTIKSSYSFYAEYEPKKKAYQAIKKHEKIHPRKTIIANGMFQGVGLTGMIIATVAMIASVIILPSDRIEYKEFYQYIADRFSRVADSNLLKYAPETFANYFSSSYGGLGNSLNITSPGNGTRSVLKVRTSTKDTNPRYLRGDIGVDFNKYSWTPVSDLPKDTLFDSFYPEYQTRIVKGFSEIMEGAYDNFKYETIEIEYLVNTDVVLLPSYLADFSLDSNTDLQRKGDTIFRSVNNHISSISLPATIPNIGKLMTKDFMSYASNELSNQDSYFYPSVLQNIRTIPEKSIQNYFDNKSDYVDYVYEHYLSIPDNLNIDLDQFARNIPIDLMGNTYNDNPEYIKYIIAQSVSSYLQNNYKYSIYEPTAPSSSDPVSYFLTQNKIGHCALYASSMTLIMRNFGIPARYVTGFVVSGSGTETGSGYEYTLLEKNLHAWVEVYFDEIGWIPFDPTSSSSDQPNTQTIQTSSSATAQTQITTQSTTGSTSATNTTTNKPTSNTTTTSTSASDKGNNTGNQILMTILIFVAIILVVVGIAFYMLYYAQIKQKRAFTFYSKGKKKEAVRQMYTLFLKLLALRKLVPQKGELPNAFFARVDLEFCSAEEITGLKEVMDIFMKNDFSDELITDEERLAVYKFIKKTYNNIVLQQQFFVKNYYKLLLF